MWEVACFTVFLAVVVFYLFGTLGKTHDSGNHSLDAFIRKKPPELRSDGDSVSKASRRSFGDTQHYMADRGRHILILYGTEYGFSEEVATVLCRRIQQFADVNKSAWNPRLLSVEHFNHFDLDQEQMCFIVISTSGDGVPPSAARGFMEALVAREQPFSRLAFSVLALGDSNYPHFCRTGKLLANRLLALEAHHVVKPAEVDGEDWDVINQWMHAVLHWLGSPSAAQAVDLQHEYLDWAKINQSESDGYSDALGIYPMNNPDVVQHILDMLLLSGGECVPVPSQRFEGDENGVSSREALLWYYDIKQLTMATLSAMKNVTSMENAANRDQIINSKDMELVDVLEEWDINCSSSFSLDIISTLRPLQPRYYSISSSPLLDKNLLTITAAVVRYTTHGKPREGVASTYLQDRLVIGGQCPVFVSSNPDFRLPVQNNIPIILIDLAKTRGNAYLYFGCRHPEKDFLYRKELETWESKGIVKLRVAFSRHQQHKVYVQHLLQEDSYLVWNLIAEESAVVYVCGDAWNMAPDVNTTLLNIIRCHMQCGIQAAEDFLAEMEAAGRYKKDVWLV
ncbi:hypothetical protein BaRGS_00009591 [Batillaria attramentaria]|uniref:Uncharacterized protein n=1 Tax=Batillaria attramentaria TaxID=370345 RepID=A0ABD0LJ90_9CAEN